jgi:hypothetical protein
MRNSAASRQFPVSKRLDIKAIRRGGIRWYRWRASLIPRATPNTIPHTAAYLSAEPASRPGVKHRIERLQDRCQLARQFRISFQQASVDFSSGVCPSPRSDVRLISLHNRPRAEQFVRLGTSSRPREGRQWRGPARRRRADDESDLIVTSDTWWFILPARWTAGPGRAPACF